MSIVNRIFSQVPLGINLRNYIIREVNSEESLKLVKDKMIFKRLLATSDLPISKTYAEIHDFTDLKPISSYPDEFVIKPAMGHGGNGIIVIRKQNDFYINPSGNVVTDNMIKAHVRRILDGEFSGSSRKDSVIIEECVHTSEKLKFKEAIGLPDVRVFCYNYSPVMAMLRYPNKQSDGKANLAKGALGIGIDINTGLFTHIHSKKHNIRYSLTEIGIPADFIMPKWDEMKIMAARVSRLTGLQLSGVDLVLDKMNEIKILEVNGRPGLEIQNINEKSLIDIIASWNNLPVPSNIGHLRPQPVSISDTNL